MDDAIAHFDGKKFSYTFENGWAFTNHFRGSLRVSHMESRGELRETVAIRKLAPQRFLIGWVDEEMGPITQMVDFEINTIWVSVFYEDKSQIWSGVISDFSEDDMEISL